MGRADSSSPPLPPRVTRESTAPDISPRVAHALFAVRSAMRSAISALRRVSFVVDGALEQLDVAQNSIISATYPPEQRMDNPLSPRTPHSTPHPKPDSVYPPRPPDYPVRGAPDSSDKRYNAPRHITGTEVSSQRERVKAWFLAQCKKFGINPECYLARMEAGWTDEDAVAVLEAEKKAREAHISEQREPLLGPEQHTLFNHLDPPTTPDPAKPNLERSSDSYSTDRAGPPGVKKIYSPSLEADKKWNEWEKHQKKLFGFDTWRFRGFGPAVHEDLTRVGPLDPKKGEEKLKPCVREFHYHEGPHPELCPDCGRPTADHAGLI